jgi:crotonobetainyl-CoA:carnitine CoA-transferase CaiB-like acyl-CoA transferase
LRSENPGLIYASLTGFGHTGPRRQQAGYDTVIQAMTGIMTATGEPDGPPTRVGVAWIDVMAGLVTTIGILAALQERAQSGAGQQIDLSLFDVGLMAMVDVAQDYLQNGRVQRRAGNVTRNISPAQVFATRDGWVVIAVGNDGQFARLCTLLGCPEITADPRFASNLARVAHRGALSDFLGPLIAAQERDDFVARLHGTNVPGSAILDIGETLRDAQAGARGAVWQVPSGAAALAMLASPLRHLSRTPAEPAGPPPALGEHSSAVLRDRLGLSEDDFAVLVRDGVVRTEA